MREVLKLALEALETCCAGDYSTGHVIDPSFDEDAVNEAITAIKEALDVPETNFGNMVQPEPPPECKTEEEKTAFAFGWWKALETQRMAQPDYRAVKTYHEGKPVYVSQSEQDTMTLQEVWDAAGNNPEIKPTKKDVLLALKLLDAICEAADVPPEQEPVAFISPGGHIHYDPYLDSVPLYTTPPKRPWVGLTDEDLEFWTKELGQEELGRGVLRAVADHLKKENT